MTFTLGSGPIIDKPVQHEVTTVPANLAPAAASEKALTPVNPQSPPEAVTEFLLLPDGRILVQNLSPTMAAILRELNHDDEALARRANCLRDNFPVPVPSQT